MVLGLGSNQGDSRFILRGALDSLRALVPDLRVSSLYVTKPRDYTDQPDFHNLAVSGSWTLSPERLLEACHSIEAQWGRDRSREIPKGPRTLDVDILLLGNEVIRLPNLSIPHERLRDRLFALVPLLELFPEVTDPVTGAAYASAAAALEDQGVVKAGML